MVMEIHKSHWIEILEDNENNSEVKEKFIKDLGYKSAQEALEYLGQSEQTTFVGGWFLTDEELTREKNANKANKLSVFSAPYPYEDGRIVVMKEAIDGEFKDIQFRELGNFFAHLAADDPESLDLALNRLRKIIAWASNNNKKDPDDARRVTSETLLWLTKKHAAETRIVFVLLEVMGAFIYQEETKDAPPPFFVRSVGEA